ncbi:MAG: DUF4097 family beta strand repeat protein [Firmicutes bacterium]|nr:DUF4097 family beta strand repeat protein [Bacillota bacterium]
MKEERLLILTMVQEGKITAEEAAELLEALAHSQGSPREKLAERMTDVREALERARNQVEERIDAARERVSAARARVGVDGEEVLQGLDDVFRSVERRIGRLFGELPEAAGRWLPRGFRPSAVDVVQKVYEGEFPAGVSEAEVALFTRDGAVMVEAGDGPGYRVEILADVYTDQEDKAAELVAQAVRWEASPSGFRLMAGDRRDVSARVRAVLPRHLAYQLECQAADGTIRCTGLECTKLRVATADGAVRLSGIRAGELEASTAGGSIRLDGWADRARCTTADGSIEARLARPAHRGSAGAADWELRASDGRIRLVLPSTDDVGVQVDLETARGRVKSGVPGLDGEAGTPGRGLRAQTPGFEAKPVRIRVKARTASGSIIVTAASAQEHQA